jgi:Sigma-70 region 2
MAGERPAGDGRIIDPSAFESAFREHFPPVYRFIARRVGPALAEDLAAETFATAYRRRAWFEPGRGSLRSWLYGIATNLVRNHWRAEQHLLALDARLVPETDYRDSAEAVDQRLVTAILAPRLAFGERSTTAGGGPTEAVIYGNATWWRAVSTGTQAPVPQTCGKGVDLGAGGWPALIRFELSCGVYLVHSRERVDGVDALKLTGNRGLVALWVDPKTYLPVRAVFDLGQRPVQTDFRWLQPTSASLAHLSLHVPPAFRQVHPPA